MLIATRDRNGNPGYPTRKMDMVFRLVRRGRARLIGGGFKPLCVQFLDREFSFPRKEKKFFLVVWPGFKGIQYAFFFERKLVERGELKTRTAEIRKLIEERRIHRRKRRQIERKKREKKGRPRFNKERRTAFGKGKVSPTVSHLVQTVLSLISKVRKWWSLPWADLEPILISFRFDTRLVTWPDALGDYLTSPRGKLPGESRKEFVRRKCGRKCLLCGAADVELHYLKPLKELGTDLPENLACLCRECRRRVHFGQAELGLKGKDRRALGVVNTASALLRSLFVRQVSAHLAIEKNSKDPLVGAFSAATGLDPIVSSFVERRLRQFRRHRRQIVHAVRDRLYRIDGKIAARNRNRRTDQKELSWNEYRKLHPKDVARVEVVPAKKLVRRGRTDVRPGNVYRFGDFVFVAEGSQNRGSLIHSRSLKETVSRTYVSRSKVERLVYSEGIVAVDAREELFSASSAKAL